MKQPILIYLREAKLKAIAEKPLKRVGKVSRFLTLMKNLKIVELLALVGLMIGWMNDTFAQNEKPKINHLSVSVPLIWNTSEAPVFDFRGERTESGNAFSYGLGFNYSRNIYKGLFATVGVGYFNQRFNIKRPFQFDSPSRPLWHTQSYSYQTIQWSGGLGYRKSVSPNFTLVGIITYNLFSSFRQRYTVIESMFMGGESQINHKNLWIGSVINTSLGTEMKVSSRLSVSLALLLPVNVQWNNDQIFTLNGYWKDAQLIARNRFSMGTSITCSYHF